MTTTKPICEPTGRYSQTEAAALLGVERHTVRRWERQGLISFGVRMVGGRKFTTGKQIVWCWEAAYLGMTQKRYGKPYRAVMV